jgi:hypothetical protein
MITAWSSEWDRNTNVTCFMRAEHENPKTDALPTYFVADLYRFVVFCPGLLKDNLTTSISYTTSI